MIIVVTLLWLPWLVNWLRSLRGETTAWSRLFRNFKCHFQFDDLKFYLSVSTIQSTMPFPQPSTYAKFPNSNLFPHLDSSISSTISQLMKLKKSNLIIKTITSIPRTTVEDGWVCPVFFITWLHSPLCPSVIPASPRIPSYPWLDTADT